MFSNELFQLCLLKKKNTNIFSIFSLTLTYFLIIPLNIYYNLKLLLINNNIYLYNLEKQLLKNTLYQISYYWFLFSYIFFIRITFAGKGYRLNIAPNYKNTITFSFGHSHLYYIYLLQLKPKKETKTKIIFFGLNQFLIKNELFSLYNAKPINIFTWRGLRFRKQILRKKIGKVSLYF